jgi:hypothetical protein
MVMKKSISYMAKENDIYNCAAHIANTFTY